MSHGLTRREDNVLNTKFHLKFMERLYDGPPRWWSTDWKKKHHDRPSGLEGDRLDREKEPKEMMALAHERNWSDPLLLCACVNPKCPIRSWLLLSGETRSEVVNEFGVVLGGQATRDQKAAMNWSRLMMAKGEMGKLPSACPNCGHKKPVFGLSEFPVQGKWVYVLKEAGGSLKPDLEIEIQEFYSGFIHTEFSQGQFTEKKISFDGTLTLDKIKDYTWHFFLSPMRLGQKALALLSEAPKHEQDYANKRWAAKPYDFHVAVAENLQPWSATVKRHFGARQLQTPYEYIPLVDPISWVAQISELDYVPIAAAMHALVQDPAEQSKSFIAATLAQEIGRRPDPDNPHDFLKDDFKVSEVTAPVPDEFKGSESIAHAWVERYKATLEYLVAETNDACCRVFFPIQFGLGHRIVELACQDNANDSSFLAYGLTHWAHILREMLVCQAGETFISWLAIHKDAADRIPQMNVLKGEGLQRGSKQRDEIGAALPVHVFMYLSPVVISGNGSPEQAQQDLSGHFDKLGIETVASPGLKGLLSFKNLLLDIAQSRILKYQKGLPGALDPKFRKAFGAISWAERIQAFGSTRDIESVVSVLSGFAAYTNEERASASGSQELAEFKEKLEAPAKAVEYLNERAQQLIKAGYKTGYEGNMNGLESMDEIAEKLENEGRKSLVALSAEDLETIKSFQSFRAFKVLRIGSKLLAGPIGLVLGGLELVIQVGKAREAFAAGDPAAGVAHGIQAAAAVLMIGIAAVETAALVSGAATAVWIGPVGWIAAALMLLGSLVMWLGAKNDLQLYAAHCFLGKHYGGGDFDDKTNKTWMGTYSWPGLRYQYGGEWETDDRWERQRLALLRLITGFTTWSGMSYPIDKFPLWRIKAGYVPASSYFELEMTFTSQVDSSRKETRSAAVWSTGKVVLKNETRDDESNIVVKHYTDGTVFEVRLVPLNLPGPWNWESRTRLAYDAHHRFPVTGWVKNSSGNITNTVSSAEAHEEEEKEEKGSGE